MLRNTAGQSFLVGPLVLTADGTEQTTGASIFIGPGTLSAGAGTLTHVGNGVWRYAPTQAETNVDRICGYLYLPNCVPVVFDFPTTSFPYTTPGVIPAVAAGTNLGLPLGDAQGRVSLQPSQPGVTIPNVTTVATVTSVTNGVTLAANQDIRDVTGKVLGGGASVISGVGARVVDGSGNAIAPAATALSTSIWSNSLATNIAATNSTVATNLDATITSRAASATALSSAVWTSARATYLDNVNVGGAVASQADITALNQSASRRIIVSGVTQYERPESGSVTFQIEARTYDGDGAAVNADVVPTLSATGFPSGSNLSANLSAATNPTTGVYRWTYTVSSAAALEQIRFDASATIASGVFTMSLYAQVVDLVSATWTSADASRLTAVFNAIPANSSLLSIDSLGRVLLQPAQPGVTVPTVSNLTNAPTSGDFTAAMKSSLNASTPSSVTGSVGSVVGSVGSVAGNVVGSVGSVVGSVGSVAGNVAGSVGSVVGSVGSVAGNVSGNVIGSVGSVAGSVSGNVVGSVGSVVGPVVLPVIPANWITAAGVAADAVAEIQSGLATPTNITAASGVVLAAGQPATIADAVLDRNLAGGANGGRTVRDSLRVSRNKVVINPTANTITVYAEDDTTVAWTGSLTPASSQNVGFIGVDPA